MQIIRDMVFKLTKISHEMHLLVCRYNIEPTPELMFQIKTCSNAMAELSDEINDLVRMK